MAAAGDVPGVDALIQEAIQEFQKRFGRTPVVCGLAPGRVNLIGEHTDYNDGFVLPMALPMVTVVVGGVNGSPDKTCVVTLSSQADDPKEVDIVLPLQPGKPAWANYVKGVMANFSGKIPSFDAVIVTSVPLGGGVSSSASLEVATFMFLATLTGQQNNLDLRYAAKLCQKAEHQYANMPCGIMDQMVSCLAKPGFALLLDCRSLSTDYVPLEDPDIVILITNSNVRHTLTGSEYPSRRRKCHDAAKFFGLSSLRDLSQSKLEESREQLEPVMYRYARHVVTEIERTLLAAKALKQRNYQKVGKLMNESHTSLRVDFEVSCPEVDALVKAAQKVPGVYGSRMTGGGFGGCTVTLVHRAAVNDAIKSMESSFNGIPTFFVSQPSAGCLGFELTSPNPSVAANPGSNTAPVANPSVTPNQTTTTPSETKVDSDGIVPNGGLSSEPIPDSVSESV